MTCVASGAGADRAIRIWPTDIVTLVAALVDRRRTFAHRKRVGRALHRAGVKLLGRRDLFRREIAGPADRRPRRCRVATAQELVVLRLMTLGAVRRGEILGDHESAMIERLLPGDGPMTFEARHALPGVLAHLELMHHRRRLLTVALGAFADRAGERGRRLPTLRRRPAAIDDERRHDERGGEHHRRK